MAGVTLALLGPPQITRADGTALVRARKELALLAYLAVEHRHEHSRDTLLDLFWPESSEEAARNSLRVALANLRAALGGAAEPFLLSTRHSVQFNSSSDYTLDVVAFEGLLAARRAHCREDGVLCAECATRLTQAIGLYRGDFLSGFALPDSTSFEEWALIQRERLHQQALAALDTLAASHDQQGDYTALSRAARRQIELEPWREQACRQLMRALAALGERAAALAAYERCCQVLEAELGIEPDPTTTALYEQIRANSELLSERASPILAPIARHSLPTPPDRLIGREHELASLSALLQEPAVRLVTLVGGGGTGKTRLALAVAWALAPQQPAELCWVSLAGVLPGDAELTQTVLATTVLAALDRSRESAGDPLAALRSLLRSRATLLILDNCEHLHASVTALLHDLLDAAPSVRVLATSRERLQLRGEHVVLLDGLSVPAREADDPRAYAGVQLFLARAAQRAPDFSPDDVTLAAVGRLCRLLGGLPLALELAASWVEHYHCDEIAAGVSANLSFLATRDNHVPERQRSLQATFTYSWDSLPDTERAALAQLSVFQAAFDRPAALAVADTGVPGLAALVDRSLLRQVSVGRYELHPLLRQFAAAQLAVAAPALGVDAANRHSAYYLALTGVQAAALHGSRPQAARQMLQECLPEIRQACLWALGSGQFDLLETHFTAVASLFNALGLIPEGETFVEQVLARLARSQAVPQQHLRLRGWALAELARFQFGRGKAREGLVNAEAAVAVADRAADRDGLVAGYLTAGYACMLLGELESAQAWLEQGLALAQAMPLHHAPAPGRGMAIVLPMLHNSLAMVAVARRQFATAADHEARLRQLYQTNGDWWGTALAAWWSGQAYLRIGHYPHALARFGEMLHSAERLGIGWYAQDCRIRLGQCLARLGRYGAATEMLERASASSQDAGDGHQACLALSELSLVAAQQGEHAAALRYGREAGRLAETLEGRSSGRLTAQFALGQALLEGEQAAEASSLYADGLQRCRDGHGSAFLCACLCGQAAAALLRGDHVQAQASAEELLEHVTHLGCDGLVTPLEIGLVCARVLAANDDPRARAVLERALAVLHEQAGWIDEPDERRAFLEDVPTHRAIMVAAIPNA